METNLEKKPLRFDIQRRMQGSAEHGWYVYRSVYNDNDKAYGMTKLDFKYYKDSPSMACYDWRIVRVYAKPKPMKPKKLTYDDRVAVVKFALEELNRLNHPYNDYLFRAKYILATLGFKEKV